MGKIKALTGKVLFGFFFVAVVPSLLILWARATREIVDLPVPGNLITGYIIVVSGALFVLTGMWNLWKLGNGLPMNAYPPEKFVVKGIYAFMRHPIYFGAAHISFGLSVVTRSASGFWLVSPLFTLMMVAYVTGFENERTQKIFGVQNYKPLLSLPAATVDLPSFAERIASYFIACIPWAIVYEAFILKGLPKDPIFTNLTFEKSFPVLEFSTLFYSFTYLFAFSIPLVIKEKRQLRMFITDLWFATIIVGITYLLIPFVVEQKDFIPHSYLGKLLLIDRSLDGQTAALPSFHVIWAFIAAKYFSNNINRFKWTWYVLAILISVSCITTGNHSIPDVIAGFCFYLIIIYRQNIWNFIHFQSERLSNSWHEWRFGPVRIINHGFYGGAAGFTGTLVACFFLGSKYAVAGIIVMLFAIAGAGLWAQFVEGSPKLLRPFGYYGGLIGGLTGCALASVLFSINIFSLFGPLAIAAPWIQSIGRLRCLVQGCCHGKPANDNIGIRFTHPTSRVNKISGLAGVPLHPTQLYSIGTNIFTGLFLIRLFSIGMSPAFIFGIYLILNGLGRFVEESFRGEAQTPYWAGMRIYQWIAVVNIFLGMVVSSVPNSGLLIFQPDYVSLFAAIGIGILVTIASGVDFPESNRRFARLTSN